MENSKIEKMKYKFLKPGAPHGFGVFAGEVSEIQDKEKAKKLIDAGIIATVDEAPALPEDLPGREDLAAAGLTIEELKNYDKNALVALKGIGEATAEKILTYLAK